ncbi:3-dehydroquinate synthase [Microbacterium sp. zg.Y1090]|uniref:3-dehydroquinate synthase n=1 Tax=Microbacterium TaxID=33882 RepID=UPI00214B9879|nr:MULTISPECIES: 3-dehydroquinate synthase [unclassified Microbacterium]MCR2811892.1 3-dehydroquinate synthase [Microbacterium sp. zg.Y1084]MCR2818669.1 3-dehydroquinate synthase [Microbacterium sp. zg.Y1090]MDL5486482.1 3-dehydroquinate synthase [Microbacterium sp. zg-Y1211]WIM29666.1 3-dehydroquinate synthase [Microbacterium sp. zg-Y1090]
MTEDTTTISVTGADPYDIVVGRGILSRLPELIPAETRKLLVVHPPTLRDAAEALRLSLSDALGAGRQVLLAEIPDAEAGKRIEVAAFCWQVMGQADFTRTDVVIGFGGGAVTDVAGFVAATWLRGVKVVLVPTTVLGMVDAAVGGKTGVNTAEGKNLVGAFWAPHAVLCDLEMLDSLGANERIAGYAEVVKAGFIWAPEILDLIEADPVAVVDPASASFRRTMELAIDMKARVVSEDFREAGLREILNYGHTLGHAIEHAERYQWRHGAAVSVGMMFAAELSRLAGRLPDAAAQRHRDILQTLGLPLSYRPGAWPQLLATMQRDKKTRGGMLRFIVLDDIGRPTVLQAPDESLLFAAYQELSE